MHGTTVGKNFNLKYSLFFPFSGRLHHAARGGPVTPSPHSHATDLIFTIFKKKSYRNGKVANPIKRKGQNAPVTLHALPTFAALIISPTIPWRV